MTIKIKVTNEGPDKEAEIWTYAKTAKGLDCINNIEPLTVGETKESLIHSNQYIAIVEK